MHLGPQLPTQTARWGVACEMIVVDGRCRLNGENYGSFTWMGRKE